MATFNPNIGYPTANSLVNIKQVLLVFVCNIFNTHQSMHSEKHNIITDNRAVFDNLPIHDIVLQESQKDILISFVSKLVNDTKNLDNDIVDLINENFDELLLKL